MSKCYYFSHDGSVKHELSDKIVAVIPEVGDLILLYTYIDFQEYFPKTSYISPNKTWCYINQYLIEIIEGVNIDDDILVGKVVGIL